MRLSNTLCLSTLWGVLLLLFSSCSNDQKQSNTNNSNSADQVDCLYNKPVAIFDIAKDSLTAYKFESLGPYKTSESFALQDEYIEIIQNGCDEITQEFRFQTKSNSEIVDYASDIFNRFSALDPALFAMNQFAREFQNQKELIKTGQKIQFSEIIYLKMDETPLGDSRLIRILMTSEKK